MRKRQDIGSGIDTEHPHDRHIDPIDRHDCLTRRIYHNSAVLEHNRHSLAVVDIFHRLIYTGRGVPFNVDIYISVRIIPVIFGNFYTSVAVVTVGQT